MSERLSPCIRQAVSYAWRTDSAPAFLPQGNYTLKDARLHVPDAAAMVIEWPGYVWIGNASMTTDQGLFMCKQFQFHVTRIRS